MNRGIKAMFLISTRLDDLRAKGTDWMIAKRDEGGFFEHVYSVHPFAGNDRKMRLNDRHTVIEMGGNKLRILGNVCKLVRQLGIDLIRAQDPYWCGLLGVLGGWLTGVPCAVSIHANYDKMREMTGRPVCWGSRRLAKWIEWVVLSRARMVLPIREALAEWAVANGAWRSHVRIIPHGIDLRRFDRIPAVKGGTDTIVFAGRLSRENYVYDMVRIAEGVPEATFVVIGDGPEMETMRAMAPANMILLGFRLYEEVVRYRRAARVNLCLMGGFSLIEAAASGNPVVAYDVDWHSELIEDGVTGVLVEEGDVAGVVAAIGRLLRRSSERVALGAAARLVVEAKHSMEKTSAIKVRCYEELLDETSA